MNFTFIRTITPALSHGERKTSSEAGCDGVRCENEEKACILKS